MKLKLNHIVILDGRPHRVAIVNECRALCVPLARKSVTITPLAGRPVTFSKQETGVSICPTSELDVLGIACDETVIRPDGSRIPTASFLAQLT